MEDRFVDCTYHEKRLIQKGRAEQEATGGRPSNEVLLRWNEFHTDVSTEVCVKDDDFETNVLAAGLTWDDLWRVILETTMVWISRKTFVAIWRTNVISAQRRPTEPIPYTSQGKFHVHTLGTGDGRTRMGVEVFSVDEEEPAQDWKNLFRLLGQTPHVEEIGFVFNPHMFFDEAARNADGAIILPPHPRIPLSPTTLKSCLSTLADAKTKLSFGWIRISAEQSKVLEAFPGTCQFWCQAQFEDRGRSMLESIGQDRGPKKLLFRDVDLLDLPSLEDCLRRTSTLESLSVVECRQLYGVSLVAALKENTGLKKFHFQSRMESMITEILWIQMMHWLLEHPTLEKLHFENGIFLLDGKEGDEDEYEIAKEDNEERQINRARAILDKLDSNTVLHDLTLAGQVCYEGGSGRVQVDQGVVDNEINPRLKVNRYRKHIQAAIKSVDSSQHGQLFSELLSAGEVNPMVLWLLVSGFRDLVVSALTPPESNEDVIDATDEGTADDLD